LPPWLRGFFGSVVGLLAAACIIGMLVFSTVWAWRLAYTAGLPIQPVTQTVTVAAVAQAITGTPNPPVATFTPTSTAKVDTPSPARPLPTPTPTLPPDTPTPADTATVTPPPTFTATPTPEPPTPTSTVTPSATPQLPNAPGLFVPAATATPAPPRGTITLLNPLSSDRPTHGPVVFDWLWQGDPIPPAFGFEVSVWLPGEAQAGVHDAVEDARQGIIERIGDNHYRLRVSNLRYAKGVLGREGTYWWTTALVRVDPIYEGVGNQALPLKLRYEPLGRQ
jgi:hypothetical protein